MNKIDFFNKVSSIHDTENNKYNEKLVDLILSTDNNAFNTYFQIFTEYENEYSISPYNFVINIDEDNNYQNIEKFALKVDKDKDFEKLYKLLKTRKSVNTSYCTSLCSYTKNSKKNLIFIKIDSSAYFHNIKGYITKGDK